jgi:alkylated DNA repair dioxygenase AlkB
VFGIDSTSIFSEDGSTILDSITNQPIPKQRYKAYAPRPIPACLQVLKDAVSKATSEHYNFVLVNYYASGIDSISPHSDDEHFLAPKPCIASLSLGARRDFVLKHKPPKPGAPPNPAGEANGLTLKLASGDMVVMRGPTQANWLHSIPKRVGKDAPGGRINITFRKAVERVGTDNYYNYNVGHGPPYKWNGKEMALWKKVENEDGRGV